MQGINGANDKEVDTSKLTARAFTLLVMELNHLVDSGKYDWITFSEVYDHIEKRDVLRWLSKIAKGVVDISVHLKSDVYGDFEKLYSNYLENMRVARKGDEHRKWGVQNRGLCLLIAWTNEAIQKGDGWRPAKDLFSEPWPHQNS